MNKNPQPSALLAFAFRPFFLLTGLYGLVIVAAWISYLFGGIPLPLGWSSLHWHSHEMLFGLTSTAVAGFILTAMCNWTGAPPLQGKGLLALVLLWFAGRVVMWTASWLPVGVVAVVDMLFLPALAIYVARVLLRYGNKRNLILAALLTLFGIANLLMHIGFITAKTLFLTWGELLAFNLITLMMVVIGGRIIPAFTRNWLNNNRGLTEVVKPCPKLDRLTLITTALLIPADFFVGIPALTGVIALLAGGLNLLRLWHWHGWRAYKEPLLWILHIGYGWIILALVCKGLAAFALVPPSVWQHALGVGAMGTLILGIMTRVALGHTGRPMTLPDFAVVIYAAITIAALARVLTALAVIDYSFGLMLSASGWILAFGLFTAIYWPILSRPRADGRPG